MIGSHSGVNTHKLTVSARHHMPWVSRSSATTYRAGIQEVREEENAELAAAVMARSQRLPGKRACRLVSVTPRPWPCTVMLQNGSSLAQPV